MKLVSFKVSNYRSINDTFALKMNDYTVIVGPNNSGKSNLLRALDTALNMTKNVDLTNKKHSTSYRFRANRYDWYNDIPVKYNKTSRARTEFVLKFKLNDRELEEFYEEFGSKLGGYLPIRFRLYRSENIFDIPIQGKAKSILTKRTKEIFKFISRKVAHIYIPCVRTSDLSANTIEELMYLEYNKLFENKEYREAKSIVENYEKSIMNNIESSITNTINKFIPSVNSLKIKARIRSNNLFRTSDIEVDDGVITSLDAKGDGISSLFAIAFMEHVTSENAKNKDLIVIIEEPEAHLHANSIHFLRKVLKKSSENSRIIISTHSPILVDKHKIGNNILVNGGNNKIDNVNRLKEIRDSLGVQISDNLSTAELCILVEGESDFRFVEEIFNNELSNYKSKIDDGSIIINNMGGASKAPYFISLYKSILMDIYLILDNDDSGKKALKECSDKNLIEHGEYTKIYSPGLKESELEDLFDFNQYKFEFFKKFFVDLENDFFKKGKLSWSTKVENSFIRQGKDWNQDIENEVKEFMMNMYICKGDSFIHDAKKDVYNALIKGIEERLKSRFDTI